MFQHITPELILSSVQAIAAGEKPAIEAGVLLAHVLPQSLGLASAPEVKMDPPELPVEFRRMQRRFHAQAVASWGVLSNGRDFVLVPLDDASKWEAAATERDAAIARGFYLVGCLGLTADHAPLVLTEPEPTPEDIATLMQASLVFLWPLAHGRGPGPKANPADASADWLKGLLALEDTRPDKLAN